MQESAEASGKRAGVTRYWIEMREADDSVVAEMLVHADGAAGPVDDNGLSISYGRSITLSGRQWRVSSAQRATTFIRITCVAVPTDPHVELAPESRGAASRRTRGEIGASVTRTDPY